MKAVIQRVSQAACMVDQEMTGEIGRGYMILVGFCNDDNEKTVQKMVEKIIRLRIFEDENGKMNLSLLDIGGGVLVVSQFTLCADCTHGRRPSFTRSAPPAQANELYEYFTRALGEQGVSHIETGVFGADMAVTLLNDGPVTIILDTKDLK